MTRQPVMRAPAIEAPVNSLSRPLLLHTFATKSAGNAGLQSFQTTRKQIAHRMMPCSPRCVWLLASLLHPPSLHLAHGGH